MQNLKTLSACLGLGSVGVLIFGVQPLLYGLYVQSGVISESNLGLLAALEIGGIALGSGAGVVLTKRVRARWIAAAGTAIVIAGNLLPTTDTIFLIRFLTGIGAGLLVSLAALAIAKQKDLNRSAAVFLLLQTASQYGILQWFAASGATATVSTVQIALAGLAAIAFLTLIGFVPASFGSPTTGASAVSASGLSTAPSKTGFIALGGASLFVGGAISIWAYMGVWLSVRGIQDGQIADMLTACLVGQMAGALLAAKIGDSGSHGRRIVCGSAVLMAVVAGLIQLGPAGTLGWILLIAFGATWLLVTPAITAFLEVADPSRNSIPFAAAAQLIGAAIIPTLIGQTYAASDMNMVFWMALIAIVISVGLFVYIMAQKKRSETPT